ncbi:protein CFAP20DC isoform X3 [Oryzias latipes]
MTFSHMFRNSYQGGAVFEVFSGQGKDPAARWRLCGGPAAVHKEYNKEVKGFVYCLDGSSHTVKMQIPQDGKMSLGLFQRFLVLQVNVPIDRDFSIELVITDSDHQKRRLHISTVHRQLSASVWHARIPFIGLKRNIWSTLCIDLLSMARELFKGFLTLDGITLFATCKVRRIFTMKEEPPAMSTDDMFLSGASLMDIIPHHLLYPASVNQITQVLNSETLQKAVKKSGPVNSDSEAPSGEDSGAHRKTKSRIMKEGCVFQSSQQTSGQEPPTWAGTSLRPASDSNTPDREISGVTTRPTESELSWILPDSSDPQVWNNKGSYEGFEPQLTLKEEDFIFSPRWGQDRGEREKMSTASDPVQSKRQCHPEDDFICSDEEENSTFQDQGNTMSFSVTLRTPNEDQHVSFEGRQESPHFSQTSPPGLNLLNTLLPSERCGGAGPAGMVPLRRLSPNRRDRHLEEMNQVVNEHTCASSCDPLLQEVKVDGFIQHQAAVSFKTSLTSPPFSVQQQRKGKNLHLEQEDGSAKKTVDSCHTPSQLSVCLNIHEDEDNDEEELQMLAILKSEQERDEGKDVDLSASKIRQCNVSVNLSSVRTSTRTSISTPMNQGRHYQREMNPLLQSNPREWMDVLSPPIMPPSLQRRSSNTWNNLKSLVRGEDVLVKEEKTEEEYLSLLYDPCLNCYFDPETGKYYELA